MSDTYSRVKSYVSYDRYQELYEVVDSLNRVRIITEGPPHEWLEVQCDF